MATDHHLIERDFEYIRKSYGVPAKAGGRVIYTGGGVPQQGTIVGTDYGRLLIRMDGATHTLPYHPKWQLEYVKEDTHV